MCQQELIHRIIVRVLEYIIKCSAGLISFLVDTGLFSSIYFFGKKENLFGKAARGLAARPRECFTITIEVSYGRKK